MFDHIYAAETFDTKSPIGRHVANCHDKIMQDIKFWTLESLDPRGGDWNKCLLQKEM